MFIGVCRLVKTETLSAGICRSAEAGIWFIGVCRLFKTGALSAGICRSAEAGRCLSGFAVWLKQRHCLPAFVTRRKREYGLAELVMTDSLPCLRKTYFGNFSVIFPVPPGKNFFSAPQKITSRPHTFAATGERSFRRSDPVFFRKRRCRDFFHQIIGQQNAVPLRLLFFQYPIAPFFKKRTGGD